MNFRRSPFDWLLEGVSLTGLLASFALAAGAWSTLPDVVPTHFGISGAPNGWGSKQTIWLLPGIGLLIYLLLSVAAHYPRFVNLPFAVDRNAPEVQRIIFRLLASSKAVTMLLFAYIVRGQIQLAINRGDNLGILLLPLFLAATTVPFIVYLRQLRRYRR